MSYEKGERETRNRKRCFGIRALLLRMAMEEAGTIQRPY